MLRELPKLAGAALNPPDRFVEIQISWPRRESHRGTSNYELMSSAGPNSHHILCSRNKDLLRGDTGRRARGRVRLWIALKPVPRASV